jgi:hypothetical protein
MSKLTKKQEAFCREYVVDFNGTQAAIRAGYSEKTANEQAARFMAQEKIVEFIKKVHPEIRAKLENKRQQKIKKKNGHVYIIKCEGTSYYKIGMTRSVVSRRLKNLQTSVPMDLILMHYISLDNCDFIERHLHDKYSEFHHRGEWFVFSDKQVAIVIDYMNSLINADKQKCNTGLFKVA